MDSHVPRFSVVMPAYNAASTLQRAVKSLTEQSFKDWELILVDDGSVDRTFQLAKEIATGESRLRLFSFDNNSGSAFLPRKCAIENARAEFIVPLDADDYVEKDYLMKLDRRLRESGADMVYSTIHKVDSDGKVIVRIPENGYETDECRSGRSLIRGTLYEWTVSGLGAIKKTLYTETWGMVSSMLAKTVFSDEYLTRLILLKAGNVAFSDAIYCYFNNCISITRKLSPKAFEILQRNKMVRDLVVENFPEDSEEYRLAYLQEICGIADAMVLYRNDGKILGRKDRKKIEAMISEAYNEIDWNRIKHVVSRKFYFIMRAGERLTPVLLSIHERLKRGKQL